MNRREQWPIVLIATIVHADGEDAYVRWRTDRLEYRLGDTLALDVRPTRDEWKTFWRTLRNMDFWSWEAEYPPLESDSGNRWDIDIRHKGKRVRARGTDFYPTDFAQFCGAMTSLLHGAEFG